MNPALQQRGWAILDKIFAAIQPGISEKAALAHADTIIKDAGITQLWHPTVVKLDASTTIAGLKHRPVEGRTLQHVALVDIGLVIDGHEVDCGDTRAYAPECRALVEAARAIFAQAKAHLASGSGRGISPADLYAQMVSWSEEKGFRFIAPSAGHRLGPYPTPKSVSKIRANDPATQLAPGAWMIEVCIGDGTFGAFYEDLVVVE